MRSDIVIFEVPNPFQTEEKKIKRFSFSKVGKKLDRAVAAAGPKLTAVGHATTNKMAAATNAVNTKVQSVKENQK